MKVTGMVRKIDDLGRIVIPKGIRKSLNINSGDDFQISIEDEKIILEKYSRLINYENKINILISNFNFLNSINIKVIINDKLINTNKKIKKEIIDILQERKIYIKLNLENLELADDINIYENAVINPIVLDSDLLGAVVIYGTDNIDNMVLISKILNNLIKNILI